MVPTHGLQVLESGPENVPGEHRVAIPLMHLEPAGQGRQLEAPAAANVVPPHGLQVLKSGPENVPAKH